MEWVDRELDPWRNGAHEASELIGRSRPAVPGSGASDAEWDAYDRSSYVRSALTAMLALDEALVQASIPWPREVVEDPEQREGLTRHAELTLNDVLVRITHWREACTTYFERRPLPADLEPWAEHCATMADSATSAVCTSERAAGLSPSVACSGDRLFSQSRPPRSDVSSMEQMVALGEELLLLCDLAEDVLDDSTIAEGQRARAWQQRVEDEGLQSPALVTAVDEALATEDHARAGSELVQSMRRISKIPDFECVALERVLGG